MTDTQTEAAQRHTGTLPVLPVRDVRQAIAWYVETLGFERLFDIPGACGGAVAGQVRKQSNNIMFNLNPRDADGRGGGIYLWCRVEDGDLDAFYDELRGKGLEVVDEIQDQFWGDRYFAVRDLNGYILAFNKALARP